VWTSELSQEGQKFEVPRGTRVERAYRLRQLHDQGFDGWVITNYDSIIHLQVEQAIRQWNPELVIFDESHLLKTHNSKRSRAAARIGANRRVWLLTGTAVAGSPLDLYGQMRAISPDIFRGWNWWQFRNHYAVMGGYLNKQVVGYQNMEDLRRRIRPYIHTVNREKVLTLPQYRDQIIDVEAEKEDWEEYVRLARTGVSSRFGWVTSTPLDKALRLSQLAGLVKIPATLDLVSEILSAGEPVVVFHRFLEEGDRIVDGLRRAGAEVLILRGSVSEEGRAKAVEDFQTGKRPVVLLCQIAVGSLGITLTRAAIAVYHSHSWSWAEYQQSRDRIRRIGQTRSILYRHPVLRGPNGERTIDHLILDALERKEDLANLIVHHPELLERGL
jgi:SNF2 family DNA or RNA helicase